MTPPPDPGPPDDRFDLLLAAYHDALASGPAPADALTPDLPRELAQRLRKAEAVIHLLDQDRRRSADSGSQTTLPSPQIAPAIQTGGQFGRFRILRELGRGGHGVVFLAWDPRLRREVALKVPTLAALLAPELRGRFLREAQAAAGLDHPGVVPVLEVGEVGPVWYIASRYCAGGTLADRLRELNGPLPARAAAALVATLADAVHHTHSRGVLHRDLKPGNVLLDGDSDEAANGDEDGWPRAWGRPRVGDFGLARSVEGEDGQTRTGALLGTPDYMAPEQAAGRGRDVSVATDVWALGVILYECLTGRRPFHGASDHETLQRVLAEPPAAPRSVRPGLPRDLETVCLRCLEKDVARRYGSAQELADDLRRFLAGEPVQARPVGRWERAARWARRRPAHAALFAVSTAAGLVLVAGALLHYARLREYNTDLEAAAESERRQAEEARRHQGLAERREREVRRQAYVSNLWLAGRLWAEGQTGLLAERLNQVRPGPGEEDLRGFEWHYLWRQSRGLRHLRVGIGGSNSVAFSPDGRLCASGGMDGLVHLWDAATGELRTVVPGHSWCSMAIAFSPDGRTLASAGPPKTPFGIGSEIQVWDVASGRQVAGLTSSDWGFQFASFSPDGQTLAVGGTGPGDRGVLRFLDPASLRDRPGPASPRGWPTWGAFSPCGGFFTSAYLRLRADGEEGRRVLHDLNLGTTTYDRLRADGGVAADGVVVWDRVARAEKAHVPGAHGYIRRLAYAPDGRSFATTSDDGGVKVWDAKTGGLRAAVRHFASQVLGLGYSPDGSVLAAAGETQRLARSSVVRLLDAASLAPRREELRFDSTVMGLAFSPDGRTIALACGDRMVRLWQPAGPERCVTLAGHGPKEAWAVAFTPDGRLASGGDDHLVRLWDTRAAPPRCTELGGHTALVSCVAASPDGRLLASGDYDKAVRLWDAATGQPRGVLAGHPKPLRALAFSPDGKLLASGCKGGVVKVWDAATGKALHSWVATSNTFAGTPDAVRCVAFSPNGRLLAVGCQDSRVRLYETTRWRQVGLIETPSDVLTLAFLGGEVLVTGHKDGVVRTWDAATGQPRLTLLGHTGEVRGVAASPDGRTIASAGADRTVRLWHAATGLELLSLGAQEHEVNGLAFSADGRRLAAALHDGKLKVWTASDTTPGGGG